MKTKIIYLLTVAAAISVTSATASAQETTSQRKDTVINVESPVNITIVENSKGVTLLVADSVGGADQSLSIEYPSESVITSRQSVVPVENPNDDVSFSTNVRKKGRRFSAVMRGLCLGLSNPLGQTCGDGLEWGKSIEIGWLESLALNYSISRRCSFELGIGFDWRNYKITTSDKRLVIDDINHLQWGEYPEDCIAKYSRLKVFSLQFPLLFVAEIPGTALTFSAGPIFNFNTYASVLTRYEDSLGNKYKDFQKGVDNRIFTIDIYGSLLLKGIGIYARYSPMKVMNGTQGINFTPLSLGVEIGNFSF